MKISGESDSRKQLVLRVVVVFCKSEVRRCARYNYGVGLDLPVI